MRFKNQTVLVTGSSQGIGSKILLSFAREGANVVINYSQNKRLAEKLQLSLSNSVRSIVVKADVSKTEEVREMFSEISSNFGGIDILINNAAIYKDSTIWKMDEEVWDEVIDIDLKGVYNCTKFASQMMRDSNFGRIINMSSVVGQTSSFGTSNYAAAKAGVNGFTRAIATELAQKKITVNSLSLGFIEEGMLLRLPESTREKIMKQIPVGRWGKVNEVIEAVFFLSSKSSGYITGQTINLNGGYYMS